MKLIFTSSFAVFLHPPCISDEGWYIAAVCMQPLISLLHPPTVAHLYHNNIWSQIRYQAKNILYHLLSKKIKKVSIFCLKRKGLTKLIMSCSMQPLLIASPPWPTYSSTTYNGLRWDFFIMIVALFKKQFNNFTSFCAVFKFSQHDYDLRSSAGWPKRGVSQMDFQQSNDWTNPTTPALTWQQWVGSDQRDRNQWGGQISHWSVLNNADKSHHSAPPDKDRQTIHRCDNCHKQWELKKSGTPPNQDPETRCLPWLHLSKCLTISSLCIIILYFRHRWKAWLLTDWMTRQKMNFIYHVMVDGVIKPDTENNVSGLSIGQPKIFYQLIEIQIAVSNHLHQKCVFLLTSVKQGWLTRSSSVFHCWVFTSI